MGHLRPAIDGVVGTGGRYHTRPGVNLPVLRSLAESEQQVGPDIPTFISPFFGRFVRMSDKSEVQ